MEKITNACVYPSTQPTIYALDETGHTYSIINCIGFSEGETQYVTGGQEIQFIEKKADGTIIPGVQSEQLVLMLIDRHKKLNAAFPSAQFDKMIVGLEMFLSASRERVDERLSRGVMGELKK